LINLNENIFYITDVFGKSQLFSYVTGTQYGFRISRSYETQLTLFFREILKSDESKKQLDALFLDFKKTYDKVPNKNLSTNYSLTSEIEK
jgi:hypothetical protein